MTGSAPDWDRSSWLGVKFSLGLDFPNLPYYMDGKVGTCLINRKDIRLNRFHTHVGHQVKLTQTNAILRHIARQHDMCGNTAQEQARVDMAAEQVMAMR